MKKLFLLVPILLLFFFQTGSAQESPVLQDPPDLSQNDSPVTNLNVTFRWIDLTGVLSFTWEIANDPLFLTVNGPGVEVFGTQFTPPSGTLSPNTIYYWRVRGNFPGGPGPYSAVYCFRTAGTPSQEVNHLSDKVDALVAANLLSTNQGNILDNRLNQADHQIGLNHDAVAILQLALFEVRVTILQVSNQLSTANANSLRNDATTIINLILTGNKKVTAADYHDYLVPQSYSLSQNYPNPFNPSTAIEYSIPSSSRVTLKIYDMLGKEVATVLDKEQEAGSYIANWNASGTASGIYFYRLTAGSFKETRKMILAK